jgi:hypothetical protein
MLLSSGTYHRVGPYVSWCFGRLYHLHLQGRKSTQKETTVQQVVRWDHSDFRLWDTETFLRNVGSHTDYTALYPRKWPTFITTAVINSNLLRLGYGCFQTSHNFSLMSPLSTCECPQLSLATYERGWGRLRSSLPQIVLPFRLNGYVPFNKPEGRAFETR